MEIIELNEVVKDIVIGDKNTIEVIKSFSSPRRFYLVGKATISSSNTVIEGTSKSLAIFVEVV